MQEQKSFIPNLVSPEKWEDVPIKLAPNPYTGIRDADDSYGKFHHKSIHTLQENRAPLVVPDIENRPLYKGINELGHPEPELALPGGILSSDCVVREALARGLENIESMLQQYFAGKYRLAIVDGYRSCETQAAGFTKFLREKLEQNHIKKPGIEQLIELGRLADITMAWVDADKRSQEYRQAESELRADRLFMEEIQNMAAKKAQDIDELIFTYITISANSGMGLAASHKIPLDNEKNAHASGGAADAILIDPKGKPLNLVSVEHAGPEANLLYLEDNENYGRFLETAFKEGRPFLKDWMKKLGYEKPEDFTLNDWECFKRANRVRFYAFSVLGGTTYNPDSKGSPEHRIIGENWHFNLPRTIVNHISGKIIFEEPQTQGYDPLAGNTCQTALRVGEQGVAVWGAQSARQFAAKHLGLVQ